MILGDINRYTQVPFHAAAWTRVILASSQESNRSPSGGVANPVFWEGAAGLGSMGLSPQRASGAELVAGE